MTLSARRKRRGACGAAGGRVTGTRRLQIQVGTPIPVHEGRFLRDMEKKHGEFSRYVSVFDKF